MVNCFTLSAKDGWISFESYKDKEYVTFYRRLKPSRLSETLIFKNSIKNKKCEVFFFVSYGEVDFFKTKLCSITKKNFARLKNKIFEYSNKFSIKKTSKFYSNILLKYEKVLFNKFI